MKVIQVTPGYPPSTGGVEHHVEAISTRLVDRGHDVTVVSADADVGQRREQRDGVVVRRCRSLSPAGAYHIAPGITSEVRRADVDVVHAHNYHSLTLPATALAVADAQFVVTPHYHGRSESGFRDRLLRMYRYIGGSVLRRADAVIAVSEWEHEQLATDFGIDTTVIPNGIDVGRFKNADPYEHDCRYILCVGRLEKYKGVQHVIRALSELPKYDLLVAGSGSYRDKLEEIAQTEDVADRVRFLGYVEDSALPRLYAGAEVYVTMSEFEAFGITVGEALAARTPCVVRKAGALEDWSKYELTCAVENTDVHTLVKAIKSTNKYVGGEMKLPQWNDVVDALEDIYRSVQ